MRIDPDRALEVRDRCLLLLLVFKRVVCTDYCGLQSSVSSVCFSPDGKQVASGSWDESVKIWETSTGTCVSTLNVDSGTYGVQSISYSPAGDMIAAGCANGKIHILDTVTVAVKRSLNGHLNCIKSVTWNNDGTKLASGSLDHTVRIWSVGSAGTFESESTLRGDQRINCVAFSGKI